MTTEQLKSAHTRRPFVPFVIRQADGRETRVTHPEALAYGGGRIAVYVPQDGRVAGQIAVRAQLDPLVAGRGDLVEEPLPGHLPRVVGEPDPPGVGRRTDPDAGQ